MQIPNIVPAYVNSLQRSACARVCVPSVSERCLRLRTPVCVFFHECARLQHFFVCAHVCGAVVGGACLQASSAAVPSICGATEGHRRCSLKKKKKTMLPLLLPLLAGGRHRGCAGCVGDSRERRRGRGPSNNIIRGFVLQLRGWFTVPPASLTVEAVR